MVKYLPIGYPHQCPHRGGMSKNFCHFQGRSYSIRCQGHWNEFPEDCPLTTEKNSDNSEEKQNSQPTQVKIPATPTPEGEICPVCTGKGWSPKKVLFAAGDKGMLDAEIKEYCSPCNGSGKLLLT